jgi:serine/threonine protein kinase
MLQQNGKTTKVPRDLHELVGQVVDERFRVLKLLYVSPRQWLYEVEPPSVGRTRRALKLIALPNAREPKANLHLVQLSHLLKEVKSPYVEEFFDLGWLNEQTPYLIQQWHPLPSLYENLRRGSALPWHSAKKLLLDIAKGLQALHEKGIIHGDLRTQHILLKDQSSTSIGTPILIDCGLQTVFQANPIAGLEHSLAYWAPEISSGVGTQSFASDLYSFGVIAYYCLTGKLPFIPMIDPLNPRDPAQMLIEMHLEAPPPPLKAECPELFKQLYLRLLSKDPSQRLSNAKELLFLLENIESPELLQITQQWGQDKDVYLTPVPVLAIQHTPMQQGKQQDLMGHDTAIQTNHSMIRMMTPITMDQSSQIDDLVFQYQQKQSRKLKFLLVSTVLSVFLVLLIKLVLN